MTLGHMIAQLGDAACVEEALAGLDDIVLLTRLRAAAEAAQEPLAGFASGLVGQFLQHADAAAWLSLVTIAARAPDPASASLHRMLSAALPVEASSGHHHTPAHDPGAP
ncbi:MAG TPA: hypothetical protein VFR19_06665 [Hyphomicrobiaceae bacterium]|nr:hypothetical protein [Hyphomicrobiaceae bacterium]